MKKIAITGTIGSGKSAVCQILRELGCVVFDCDKRVDCYYSDDHHLFKEIALLFPNCVEGHRINKKCVAEILFSQDEVKRKLESLIYATLETELLKEIETSDQPLFFAEVPLLFECGWEKHFDEVALIVCDEEIALERLVRYRGLLLGDARKRLRNQGSNQSKIERASKIIYNNSNTQHLKIVVEEWLSEKKKVNELEN